MYRLLPRKLETKMEIKTNLSSSDVLHSDHHSKLSAEEIAKAVARHNRHHPGNKTVAASGKPQTRAKK
jgi:hypothetical protein